MLQRALFVVVASVVACGSAEIETPREEAVRPLPIAPAATTADEATPLVVTHSDVPSVDDMRDLRHSRRARGLLVVEASQLEALAATLDPSSSDRPALLRRAAETYSELRKLGAPTSAKARRDYEILIRDYPQLPTLDEIYYDFALECEAANDMTAARRSYFSIVQRFPSSKYVPYAYFAFGEMFYEEGKSDPSKLELAKQAYVEALKYSASPIASEAVARLALVLDKTGDSAAAANMRAKLERDYAGSPAARRLSP